MYTSWMQRLQVKDWHKTLLMAFAFSVPFERMPGYDIAGMTIRLSTLVGLALIVVAFLHVTKSGWPRVWSGMSFWLLCVFGLWAMLSFLQVGTTKDYTEALKVLAPLLFFISVSVSIAALMKRAYIYSVLRWLLIGCAVAIAFGFFQFFGNYAGLPNGLIGLREEYSWERFGFPRMQSVALEPLYFGASLLLPASILLALLSAKQPKKIMIRYSVLLILLIIAVFLTVSRGALLSLFIVSAGMAIVYALHHKNIRHLAKIASLGVGVIIILGVLALLIFNVTGRQGVRQDLTYNERGAATILSHFRNFRFSADKDNIQKADSIGVRQLARNQAVEVLRDNKRVLLFGLGPGQYQTYVRSLPHPIAVGMPNNIMLELLTQFGIVGLTVFCAMYLSVIARLLKKQYHDLALRLISCALAVYFIALFVQAQTFSGIGLTHLWFAVGISLFLLQLPQKETNRRAASKKTSKS